MSDNTGTDRSEFDAGSIEVWRKTRHWHIELSDDEWQQLSDAAQVKGIFSENLIIDIIQAWLRDNQDVVSVAERRREKARLDRARLELQIEEHCMIDDDRTVDVEQNLEGLKRLFDLGESAGPRQVIAMLQYGGAIYSEGRVWLGLERGIEG